MGFVKTVGGPNLGSNFSNKNNNMLHALFKGGFYKGWKDQHIKITLLAQAITTHSSNYFEGMPHVTNWNVYLHIV